MLLEYWNSFPNRIIVVPIVTGVVVDMPGHGQPQHLGPGASWPPALLELYLGPWWLVEGKGSFKEKEL